MTKQEAYEKVREYLTRPGARRAYDPTPVLTMDGTKLENGCCRYAIEIDGETQKCAVGILLKQEDLDRSMASFVGGVESLLHEYGWPDYIQELGNGADDEEQQYDALYFLNRLQVTHDVSDNWPNGRFDVSQLDRLARDFGLSVPE